MQQYWDLHVKIPSTFANFKFCPPLLHKLPWASKTPHIRLLTGPTRAHHRRRSNLQNPIQLPRLPSGRLLRRRASQPLPELVLQVLNKLSNVGTLALSFFRLAEKQSEFKHSTETFHTLIEALGKIRQFKIIWTLVNDMNSQKLLSFHTFALVAGRYARAGKTKEAVETFEKMSATV
ncbi:hypothetical protein Fmac_018993 [Flemingia macrophylla]|uniref:Pentatricopeptide repeat-containing protein n=1 Tax=Flemingia macrophylla TaxID=520843 RepID=A0ABD1M6Z9_9FABA